MSGIMPIASPTMKRLSPFLAPCTPGVSTKTIWPRSLVVDAGDPVARGLRLGRDDGQLLADDAVEQRRLADVRSAQDGDRAGDGLAATASSALWVSGHEGGFYITRVS